MKFNSMEYSGKCSCGRTHDLETQFCVIESGCLKDIDIYLKKYDLTGFGVAVYDDNTYLAAKDRRPKANAEVVLPAEDLHANERAVAMLLEQLPQEADYLIAVGSGTVHDIVRYCAHERGIDFVSCPTAASVDGFCSSVAAMTWCGCKKTFIVNSPKLVVADLDIIVAAPLNLAKSGFTDLVGKYVALTEWKIANVLTGEHYCERIAQMTLQATQSAVDAVEGIVSGEKDAYEKLVYGLLLSGLAMQMMGNSRPASGSEHHISHFIEMKPENLPVAFDALHGEKVGVGTLMIMELYQKLLENETVQFADYTVEPDETIVKVFGKDRLDALIDENKNDSATAVTADLISEKWQDIKNEISAMPKYNDLKNIYEKCDIKSKLSDIGVGDEYKEFVLRHAPLVRCRLTLLRLISRGVIKA